MRRPIDPKIDCVFKALLGSEENRNLLIHFLNAACATSAASVCSTTAGFISWN